MTQIICELKKTDNTNRVIPEIKNRIAIRKELRWGFLGAVCILVFRPEIYY
jgi:hypothetical protein